MKTSRKDQQTVYEATPELINRAVAYLVAHPDEGVRGAASIHGLSDHELAAGAEWKRALDAEAGELAEYVSMAKRHRAREVVEYLTGKSDPGEVLRRKTLGLPIQKRAVAVAELFKYKRLAAAIRAK